MTFHLLKSLPCDIFLEAHGNYHGMEGEIRPAGFEEGSGSEPVSGMAGFEGLGRRYLPTVSR